MFVGSVKEVKAKEHNGDRRTRRRGRNIGSYEGKKTWPHGFCLENFTKKMCREPCQEGRVSLWIRKSVECRE